jgi:hypothetical protein
MEPRYPSKQREMALTLLENHIEGSFSTAFLEAFIRADLENQALLGKVFDQLSQKFSWQEKIDAIQRRREA